MRTLLGVPFEELKTGDVIELPSGDQYYITEIFSNNTSLVIAREDRRGEILLDIKDAPKALLAEIIYMGPPQSSS